MSFLDFRTYIKIYIDSYLKSYDCIIKLKETNDNKYYISFITDENISYIYDSNDNIYVVTKNVTSANEYKHITFFEDKYKAKDVIRRIKYLKEKILSELYKQYKDLMIDILKKKENSLLIYELYADDKVEDIIKNETRHAEYDYYTY